MSSFVEECLTGDATVDEIDNWVAAWHKGDDDRDIHEFLGLTPDEYALWVEQPASLSYILFSRHHGVALEEALELQQREPVAARAATAEEAGAVLDWLRRTGRIR